MIFFTAFVLGFMGSVHCLGMCGPIALALPVPSSLNRTWAILFYNFGRIAIYGILGAVFGFFGQLFVLAGFQQFLSVALGAVILVLLAYPLIFHRKGFSFSLPFVFQQSIKNRFSSFLNKSSYNSFWLMGALNGLLPCGLVYVAISGAIVSGNAFFGGLYMVLFGLGTAPAMWTVGFFGKMIGLRWRLPFAKWVPFSTALVASLLIVRGMNLGVPYLSPKVVKNQHSCCTLQPKKVSNAEK